VYATPGWKYSLNPCFQEELYQRPNILHGHYVHNFMCTIGVGSLFNMKLIQTFQGEKYSEF